MFFIGVFGIENKDKELKRINNIRCRNCNTITEGRIIKKFNFFHFFFIPLFRWNENYYFMCDTCNAVYEIKKEKGKAIEAGEEIDITYWDLNEVNTGYYSDGDFQGNVCKSCGNKIESTFKYCPYCGTKIN